jgi:hypothetical protein
MFVGLLDVIAGPGALKVFEEIGIFVKNRVFGNFT